MSRFFVKIYLAIILTLLATGLVFDRFWFSITQRDAQHLVIDSITTSLIQLKAQQTSPQLFFKQAEQLLRQLKYQPSLASWQFQLIPFSQAILDNQQWASASSGQLIVRKNSNGLSEYWTKIDEITSFLVVTKPRETYKQKLDFAIITLFYLAIALGVYLALRPIIQEMKQLQQQVLQFGTKGWHYRINLRHGSPFHRVVESFNQMASRIEQLVASQKELSHAVAHELRTPIARIKFSIESLKHIASSNTDQTAIYDITQDIAELDSLISEMLDYASFDAAKYQLQLEKGLLNVVIEEIAQKHSGPHINIKTELGSPIWLVCDWHLLERAIQNIVTNAIKYGNGEIVISLQSFRSHASIYIDDNGQGIDERYRDKVFQSFTRLPQHRKDKKSGFGLGLPIVKKIIELHRGKIIIDDSPLGGARFVVTLPI